MLLATGSVNGLGSTFFVADDANSPELPYAKIESISDGSALASSLDGNFEGLLIHSSSDNKFYRYNGTAFVELPVAAGSFVGTLPVTNGGTGQTTYTNGQLLIGNSTGNTLTKATLTEGAGIDITNGTGTITIAAETATTGNAGIVELATDNEVSTGSDTSRAITPSSLSVATVATASYVSGSNVDGAVTLASLAAAAANATNAANVDINNVSANTEYGLIFRDGNTDGNQALYADNELDQPSYNPSTNTIKTPIISASSALYVGGNITVTGTVDGVDVSALNSTVSTNTSNIATLTAATSSYLTTVDISDDTNLTAGTGITLTGDTLSTNDSQIVHDNLSGFVSNEHINHTSVSITAGDGLSGGGTIAATRTLTLDTGSTHFTEAVEDTIGGMLTGNTETLITVTYQDGDGTIDFVVDNDLSNYSNASTNFITTGASVGGDLSGTIASATVTKIQNTSITSTQASYLATLDQSVSSSASPTFAGLTVTGDVSVQGSLTTVNSNEVNLGDRIITLNTADGAGDAGIQVHDTSTAETGSLLWDTDGNYWKVGVSGSTDYRLVEWDGETAGGGDFIHTDSNGRINAINTTTDGDLLISDGDGTFTVTNVIDGGTY